eukprot:3897346-Amphidinium_carterae.1
MGKTWGKDVFSRKVGLFSIFTHSFPSFSEYGALLSLGVSSKEYYTKDSAYSEYLHKTLESNTQIWLGLTTPCGPYFKYLWARPKL